ncbi:MAG: hypothetical protein HYR84_12355 [Planctomycetes bacterium]|nr:hypothetical protein [Planctomycetota bacterium]
MFKALLTYCAELSQKAVLAHGMLLAIIIEAVTIAFRFGLNLQSTRDTAALGAFTLGLRVHHGYIGVFLVPLAWCFPTGLRHLLWIIAIGLIVSDLAHHFLVLWPITGSPQFDFVYPDHPWWRN